MKNFNLFPWYRFYNAVLVRILRITVLISLTIILVLTFEQFYTFRIVLIIYTFYLIHEIFIHFKIDRAFPRASVQNSPNSNDSVLFKTKKIISEHKNIGDLIRALVKEHDVSFMISKLGGYTFGNLELDVQIILLKALELAQKCKGNYITSADFFAAYLVLTEDKTKYFIEHEVTENDLIEILLWAREKFQLDQKKEISMHFTGYGVFDFFIYGWDTLIKEYSFDLTYSVLSKNSVPIIGREEEFHHLVEILSKNNSNNVLLIGEPGVGKASLVQKLALESYRDPRFILAHRKVYELLVDRLVAGVQSAGDLEERLGLMLSELEHTGNIIIFIQNIENIFGGGGFGMDMSGILYSYLKSGRVQVVGTTTSSFYKSIIEKKKSIIEMFEKIEVEEPERETLFRMIAGHTDQIESEYRLTVSYKAIHASIELSSSYLPDTFLPGKAINLLQDAASRARLEGKSTVEHIDVVKIVEEKTSVILEKPNADEKKILLNLEVDLHKRVIGQDEAITAVSKSIRRLRSGFSQHTRPISVFLFLGPTGVGKTETAKALAKLYFGDEDAMIRLDMSEYQTQNEVERLLGGVPGGESIEGSLPEAVHQHPFSLILLDEFEKAHPQILDIFLQVFEDGRLTDNQGRTVSFKNTIIIVTSNAGSETIREMINEGKKIVDFKSELVEGLLTNGLFKPELLNRFDDVIIFKPLTMDEAGKVAGLLLGLSLKTLEDDQIFISFDKNAEEKVVAESYDEEAGARNMRRYVGATVEDFISKLILEDKLKAGTHAVLTTDDKGNFILQ